MIKKIFLILFFNIASCWIASAGVGPLVRAFFAPHALPVIVNLIRSERKEIYFAYYTLTSNVIARALIEAHERGVKVEGIVDPYTATANNNQLKFLVGAGIRIFQYAETGLMHHKFTLLKENPGCFDEFKNQPQSLIQTGSSNMTEAASTKNCENILVVNDLEEYKKYLQEFESIKKECVRLKKATE